MTPITIPGSPFPLDGVMAFAWIGFFLLVGMVCRRIFPFFRRYLIPACIIGGAIGLAAQYSGLLKLTGFAVGDGLMQVVVFHLFNLTWVFLGLKATSAAEAQNAGEVRASAWKTVVWLGLLTLVMVALVNVFSVGGTWLLHGMGAFAGPASLGVVTTSGFIGGPGQALTATSIWAQVSPFTGLNDFALAAASMGYAVAIVVGIPLMNIIARKLNLQRVSKPSFAEECGFYDENDDLAPAGSVTTVPNNIDVLAYHLALGFVTYALAFVLTAVLVYTLPASVRPLIWGVFFLICCICGILVRKSMAALGKSHLNCIDVNARISNTLVDFLVCGTFISIEIGAVGQYVAPYLVSCLAVTLTVAAVIYWYCGHLRNDAPEMFAFLFGTFTGTISTGLVLLRMIDPENRSSVPVLYGIGTSLATPGVVALTLMMHMEVVYHYSVPSMLALYALVALACFVAMRFIRPAQAKKLWGTA